MNHYSPGQDASFLRIRSEGKTEEIVRRLIEAMDLGIFAEGDQLPNEADLASQFGVAIVTLREALALLREQGFVETRRGRSGGSFVRANFEVAHARLIDEFRRYSVFDLRDYADEYAAISSHAARLAAIRASPHEVEFLFGHVALMEKAVDRSEQRRADMRFHVGVAVVSQSVRLTQAELQLQSELGMFLWMVALDAADLKEYAGTLRAIVEAIANSNAPLAGALSESLCESQVRRVIEARLTLGSDVSSW